VSVTKLGNLREFGFMAGSNPEKWFKRIVK
jgi:hypothetical protein